MTTAEESQLNMVITVSDRGSFAIECEESNNGGKVFLIICLAGGHMLC